MKDKLHFIVGGGLALLGMILLGAGMAAKSGASETLTAAEGKLAASPAATVPTLQDVDQAEELGERFTTTTDALKRDYLNGSGARLAPLLSRFTSSQEFKDEACRAVNDLKGRVDAISAPPRLPTELAGYGLEEPSGLGYFETLLSDWSNPPNQADIPIRHAQLKIMEEVVIVCEQLMKRPEFAGAPFHLVKFEFGEFKYEPPQPEQPWAGLNFQVVVECPPAFGVALLNQLVNPDLSTAGKAIQGEYSRHERAFYPLNLVAYESGPAPRPFAAEVKISNDQRKAYGIREDLNPESENDLEDWEEKRKEIAADLAAKIVVAMPARCTLKLQALDRNEGWRIFPADEE